MISVKGTAKVVTLARTDPVFARVRAEAESAVRSEPDIAGFIFSAILNQDSLEAAIVHRLAARLAHQAFPGDLIEQAYFDAMQLLYRLSGRLAALNRRFYLLPHLCSALHHFALISTHL
jgi:hypothetical protein